MVRDLVALAALLHGIVNLWEKTQKGLYQKFIIPYIKSNFPQLADASFFTNPYFSENNEVADLRIVVDQAYSLAVGLDGLKLPEKDNYTQYLGTVTEGISITDDRDSGKKEDERYFYKPEPLSIKKTSFPEKLSAPISETAYKSLWNKFIEEYEKAPSGNFQVHFDTLTHLLHKFTWGVTDGYNNSLYDHCRIASALAVAIYESKQKNAIDDKELLLISGDISGIQNFIYNPAFNGQEVYDGVAGRLRGRSFYLNLLLKTLADYLIEKLDLYSVNIVWATGGHFLIIAPNTFYCKEALKTAKKEIAEWVWQEFQGALGVAVADLEISRDEIKDFSSAKQQLSNNTSVLKLHPFTAPLSFQIESDDQWENPWVIRMQQDICRDTSRDMSEEDCKIADEYQSKTSDVRRSVQSIHFDKIGRALINARTLQLYRRQVTFLDTEKVVRIPQSISEAKKFAEIFPNNVLIEFPKFERYWLLSPESLPKQGTELRLTIINHKNPDIFFVGESSSTNTAQGFYLIADAVKTEGSNCIVEFDSLAQQSIGVNFLGVLRMDVDNLGQVFHSGLLQQERHLTKIASISRMMDWFFSGYLNTLVSNKNLYTTYAGGDDLFIVGAWNEILELAETIESDFKEFCAHNPSLHISAGIALCKGKYPIARAAEDAALLLEIAKSEKRDYLLEDTDKNSLAFLERKISWQNWYQVKKLANKLIENIENKNLSRRFVYNILQLYKNHIDPNRKFGEKLDPDIIWLPRFLYSLARNISPNTEGSTLQIELQKYIEAEKFYIPLFAGYALLKTRNMKEHTKEVNRI